MSTFEGNERFEVIRRLGVGGMGEVYEVLDRERNSRVALKKLETASPEALLRFKHEFRALDACVRLQRGRLVGGAQGQALVGDAEVWLRWQRVVVPERFAALFCPGIP